MAMKCFLQKFPQALPCTFSCDVAAWVCRTIEEVTGPTFAEVCVGFHANILYRSINISMGAKGKHLLTPWGWVGSGGTIGNTWNMCLNQLLLYFSVFYFIY